MGNFPNLHSKCRIQNADITFFEEDCSITEFPLSTLTQDMRIIVQSLVCNKRFLYLDVLFYKVNKTCTYKNQSSILFKIWIENLELHQPKRKIRNKK